MQRVPVQSMEGLSRMEVGGERFRERVARKNVNRRWCTVFTRRKEE